MPRANPKPTISVIAPLRDGRRLVVLSTEALVFSRDQGVTFLAAMMSREEAAELICRDYPMTIQPGGHPNRSVAGTIENK